MRVESPLQADQAVNESRRVKLLLIALVAAFLIFMGIQPLGLPYTPGARFSDASTSHWGAALFLQRSVMRDHEFPFWRDTILGGQPFAANPLNKTAYPLQWLALILPPALHINVMIALHLLIAGVGMWLLMRSLGLGVWSAGVSVIAYVLSPRMVAHTGAGHIDIVYAMAWLPCVLWAIRRAAQGSQRGLWATGVFAGLMFLADIRLSLFGLALAAAYGVVEVFRTPTNAVIVGTRHALSSLDPPQLLPIHIGINQLDEGKRTKHTAPLQQKFGRILRFTFPAILFLVISSAVIVPLALWSPRLTRSALTPADAGVFSLQPAYLLGAVIPQNHGNVEVLTYLGIAPFILAVIGAVTARRRALFWLIAALIAVLYALGSNGFLWNILTQIAPILLWFRVPSRAWLIVVLVIALLAGYGAEKLKAPPLRLAAILIIALELALTGRSWLEWRGDDYWLSASQRAIAERLIADGVDSVYSPTYSLEQQVAEWYEIKLFYGVDPFQLRDNIKGIHRVGGIEYDGYSVVQPPLIGAIGDDFSQANRGASLDVEQWLVFYNISHVVAAYPIEHPGLRLIDTIDGIYIYVNQNYRDSSGDALLWHDEGILFLKLQDEILIFIAAFTAAGGIFRAFRAKT